MRNMDKKQKPDWFYDKTGSRKFVDINGNFEEFLIKIEDYLRKKYMARGKRYVDIPDIKVQFYTNGEDSAMLVNLEAKPIQTLFRFAELKRTCEGKPTSNFKTGLNHDKQTT